MTAEEHEPMAPCTGMVEPSQVSQDNGLLLKPATSPPWGVFNRRSNRSADAFVYVIWRFPQSAVVIVSTVNISTLPFKMAAVGVAPLGVSVN